MFLLEAIFSYSHNEIISMPPGVVIQEPGSGPIQKTSALATRCSPVR